MGAARSRTLVLLMAGAAGVASLMLMPVERLVPLDMPPMQIRALAMVNPLVLTVVAVLAGHALAPRVGLGAPLVEAWVQGRPVAPLVAARAGAALLSAAAVAAMLLLYGLTVGRTVEALAASTPAAGFTAPLATRLLYGGIAEELQLRWGVMTLAAWIGWRAAGRPPRPGAGTMWPAILIAALLFALGHLPALGLYAPGASTAVMLAVVAANAVPGALFGWLYWRRGIETAIAAHMLAHLMAAPFG